MLLNLNICTNESELTNYPNSIVIFIGDCRSLETQRLIGLTGGVEGSAFNPPIEASQAFANGNMQAFQAIYMNYLVNDTNVNSYLLSIIQATSLLGKSVVLFIDIDSYNMYFPILNQYMQTTYGLIVGNRMCGVQGQIVDTILPQLYYRMYQQGDLSPRDYLSILPQEAPNYQQVLTYAYLNNQISGEEYLPRMEYQYTETVVNKLVSDFALNSYITNYEGYCRLLEKIKQDIINNGGHYICRPISEYC